MQPDNHHDQWMSPEEALTRFNNEEMSLLGITLPVDEVTDIRYGYRFDSIGFLVGKGMHSEVLTDYSVYPIPNCASWLAGLANIRGNLVPVYNLIKLFDLDSSVESFKHLLILGQGSKAIGVLIDSLPQSLDISEWKPVTHKTDLKLSLSEYMTASYASDGVIWMDINHEAFFRSIREKIAV